MLSELLLRKNSKYLTIYQYLQLSVTTKGQTVREGLEELEELLGKTDNKSAHENIAKTREIFDDIVADGILDNDTSMAQSIILIKLELRLNEITNDESDNADDANGVSSTSTRN